MPPLTVWLRVSSFKQSCVISSCFWWQEQEFRSKTLIIFAQGRLEFISTVRSRSQICTFMKIKKKKSLSNSCSDSVLKTHGFFNCVFTLLLFFWHWFPLVNVLQQALQSELKEREHLVVSTLDQARLFLADQPIEGPGEPRRNLQPKTGTLAWTV